MALYIRDIGNSSESWPENDTPAAFARFIGEHGEEEDLKKLVEVAATAAVAEAVRSGQNPIVGTEEIARCAVEMAVGLKRLPEIEQGEK